MPYTQHLHARKVREQTYVDVAYLLKNSVKPRKVRKSLGDRKSTRLNSSH